MIHNVNVERRHPPPQWCFWTGKRIQVAFLIGKVYFNQIAPHLRALRRAAECPGVQRAPYRPQPCQGGRAGQARPFSSLHPSAPPGRRPALPRRWRPSARSALPPLPAPSGGAPCGGAWLPPRPGRCSSCSFSTASPPPPSSTSPKCCCPSPAARASTSRWRPARAATDGECRCRRSLSAASPGCTCGVPSLRPGGARAPTSRRRAAAGAALPGRPPRGLTLLRRSARSPCRSPEGKGWAAACRLSLFVTRVTRALERSIVWREAEEAVRKALAVEKWSSRHGRAPRVPAPLPHVSSHCSRVAAHARPAAAQVWAHHPGCTLRHHCRNTPSSLSKEGPTGRALVTKLNEGLNDK